MAERGGHRRQRSQVLRRPRLEAALDGVLGHRLALVVADAGFGKTTLVTSWAAGINATIHDVGRADRELARFVLQLLKALRELVPELPDDLLGAGEHGHADGGGAEGARPDAMAELVGAELEQRLRRDVALVLDNVHLLGDGPSVRFLSALVRHAPPLLHLVLAGRTPPPVAVDRLRRQGELVELDGADLAFTPDEVAALLRTVLADPGAELAPTVHRCTAGWPAAVRLSVEALRDVAPPARAKHLGSLLAEGGRITRLAGVIFVQEPAAIKRLLAVVGLFDEVCADLLEAIGEGGGASPAALVRRGLFLEPGVSGPGWYRLHAITARAVAQHGPLDAGEATRLRAAAADWFAGDGRLAAALRALTAAGLPADVVALLHRAGVALLRGGDATEVLAAVAALPSTLRDASVERVAGEAYQLQGRWEQALACYRRATPPSGTLDAGLAWRMGLIHYLQGQSQAALAVYERVDDDGKPSRDRALLLAWRASAHWSRGEAEACGRLAVEALRVATEADDPQALAAAHTVLCMLAVLEGDARANDAHYRAALRQAERAGDVLQQVRIRANRGSHLVDEGAYAEALEELDKAVSLADLAGFAAFGGLALSNRGEARLRLGRLEEAQADLENAATIFKDLGSGMLAYPLEKLGEVQGLRGDLTAARTAFEEALRLTEATGDVQGQVPALCGLARLLIEENLESAAVLVDRALLIGTDMGVVDVLLTAGWVALASGDRSCARQRARQAGAAATSRRDRPGMAEALSLEAAAADDGRHALVLSERSVQLWTDLGDPVGLARAGLVLADHQDAASARATRERIQAHMRAIGCRTIDTQATDALTSLSATTTPTIRVETLGGFRVVRAGEVVPGSAWRSRKARDLLKILISRRGRAVTREGLVEMLWPGDTLPAAANRLNVLLSTIRSLLDPRRELAPDGPIVGDGEAVRLDLDEVEVDVEVFLAEAASGLRLLREGREGEAVRYLVRAEARYTGDFLEDSLYEDYTAPLREEARLTYRQVVAQLARQARAAGDADSATRYLLRSLEVDPYDEASHLELVSLLASSGRHGEARRHYRTYAARMEELEVEAAPFHAT